MFQDSSAPILQKKDARLSLKISVQMFLGLNVEVYPRGSPDRIVRVFNCSNVQPHQESSAPQAQGRNVSKSQDKSALLHQDRSAEMFRVNSAR